MGNLVSKILPSGAQKKGIRLRVSYKSIIRALNFYLLSGSQRRDWISLWIFVGIGFLSFSSYADVTWKGHYRAEMTHLNGVSLGSESINKNYLLHHLMLAPKVVLIDGFQIMSVLDILNDGSYSVPGSQAGQALGSQWSKSKPQPYGADGSVILSDNQIYEVRDLNIRNFYLLHRHPKGRLILGRAPIHFGLGISLNAGKGPFDHYFDNRDMVSYQAFMGGFTIQPYVARVTGGFESSGNAANEWGILIEWEREDTGLTLGLMGLSRHIPGSLNDDRLASQGAAHFERYGFFLERGLLQSKNYRYALELGFNSGDLGANESGTDIDYKGFGFAAEFDYISPIKGLSLGFKTGYASGVKASQERHLSAFAFDRNYNVGMILFNHPIGHKDLDVLSTTTFGRQGAHSGSNFKTHQTIDSESLSNAVYAAPYAIYALNSQWSLYTSILWAQLNQGNANASLSSTGLGAGTPSRLKVDVDLGIEWDVSISYKPFENFIWETLVGVFFPGKAFHGGPQNYETDTVFGGVSRVSVSF